MNRGRWLLIAIAVVAVGLVVTFVRSDGDGDADAVVDRDTTTSSTSPSSTTTTTDAVVDDTTTSTGPTSETSDVTASSQPSLGPGELKPPVALDEPADFGTGVTARLVDMQSVEAEGRLPGERSGHAVEVTIEMTNQSGDTIDLGVVTVDLVDSDGSSASPVFDPENPELEGELADGASATGVYVFSLEPDRRENIRITVKYAADVPTVVFRGNAPGA